MIRIQLVLGNVLRRRRVRVRASKLRIARRMRFTVSKASALSPTSPAAGSSAGTALAAPAEAPECPAHPALKSGTNQRNQPQKPRESAHGTQRNQPRKPREPNGNHIIEHSYRHRLAPARHVVHNQPSRRHAYAAPESLSHSNRHRPDQHIYAPPPP